MTCSEPRIPVTVRAVTVERLFALGIFHPASVQREYQWQRLNCERLLANLLRLLPEPAAARDVTAAPAQAPDEDPLAPGIVPPLAPEAAEPVRHLFLGSIVVTREPGRVFRIYDGLQRLATLTILMAVLRDLADDTDLNSRLNELIFFDSATSRINLRVGGDLLWREVQTPGEASRARRRLRAPLSASEARLREATAYFRQRLDALEPAQLRALADALLGTTLLSLIEVDDPRMARHVFVSTNLDGVRLNRVDVLKGQVMDMAADDAAAACIAERWRRLDERAGRTLDEFLSAVDFLHRREPPAADSLVKLAIHMRNSGKNVLAWLDDLDEHLDAWLAIEAMLAAPKPGIATEIWKLGLFEWAEWRPLALAWQLDYQRKTRDGNVHPSTREAYLRRFRALHRRCLVMTLVDWDVSERATKIGNAIEATLKGDNPLRRELQFGQGTLDKMRRTLSVPMLPGPVLRTTVKWIEASLWETIPEHVASNCTVEHVIPQNPEFTRSADFPDLDTLYDCANSLGNMVALDRERNRQLTNLRYEEKRPVYRLENALQYKTLEQVSARATWTPAEIRQRESELVTHIFGQLELLTGKA